MWKKIKTEKLIPNNKKIIELIENNLDLFSEDELSKFQEFKIHAVSFEANQERRLDNAVVKVFPVEFEEMIFEED